VLQFAINKLPVAVRPIATTLAKKLLGQREAADDAGASEYATGETDAIAHEFDLQSASLMFAATEGEADLLLAETDDGVVRDSEAVPPDLLAARERLVTQLEQLEQGDDPTPALEEFIPVVMAARPIIKMALTVIGRGRVAKFIARHLAGLIRPYVGSQPAAALSRALADAGLRMIAGEGADDMEQGGVAATTLAATVEDTVQRLGELSNEALEDDVRLESAASQAFFEAAAVHFPPQLLRSDALALESSLDATWIPTPRRRYRYKTYSRIFDVTITEQIARALKTFGGATLEQFLRDRIGVKMPVRARVHLYEGITGTWLNTIAGVERSSGVQRSRHGSVGDRFHPLTREAAGLLLKEPGLGRDVAPQFLQDRRRIAPGQRFYRLQISEGASPSVAGRSSQVNVTADLRQLSGALVVHVFVGERDAQSLVPRLRARQIGQALSVVRAVLRTGIQSALVEGMRNHVTVLNEAPEEQLSARVGQSSDIIGQIGDQALKWIAVRLVDETEGPIAQFLRASFDQFIAATEQPEDGVTVTVRIPDSALLLALRSAASGRSVTVRDLASHSKRGAGAAVASVSIVSGFRRQ
jgi:hypothetical protein